MITQDDIQGHWQRLWLKAPDIEDATTRVHWMQAGGLYADVRIPLDRPDLSGVDTLDDLSVTALHMLVRAEGFAGQTRVQNSVCTWARAINWHGETDTIDAGALSFDADGRLIEAGVHADYTELWERAPRTAGSGMALRGEDLLGFLVTVGSTFVFGVGNPAAKSTAETSSALAAGERPSTVSTLFDGLHALGQWRGDVGTAVLATHPLVEGKPILTRTDRGLVWHALDFYGQARDVRLRPVSEAAP